MTMTGPILNKIAVTRFLYVEKEAVDLLKLGQDIKFFKV